MSVRSSVFQPRPIRRRSKWRPIISAFVSRWKSYMTSCTIVRNSSCAGPPPTPAGDPDAPPFALSEPSSAGEPFHDSVDAEVLATGRRGEICIDKTRWRSVVAGFASASSSSQNPTVLPLPFSRVSSAPARTQRSTSGVPRPSTPTALLRCLCSGTGVTGSVRTSGRPGDGVLVC